MTDFAEAGSQRWLQIVIERRPELVQSALRKAAALDRRETVEWMSPRAADGFREYRDTAALRKAGLSPEKTPLSDFWPARGPVWDGIARTSTGSAILVEAKAHIAEAASPATRATSASRQRIEEALASARRYYAPRSKADWTTLFYQYANRLAHQYFLARVSCDRASFSCTSSTPRTWAVPPLSVNGSEHLGSSMHPSASRRT